MFIIKKRHMCFRHYKCEPVSKAEHEGNKSVQALIKNKIKYKKTNDIPFLLVVWHYLKLVKYKTEASLKHYFKTQQYYWGIAEAQKTGKASKNIIKTWF